jgi:hypothetical protein
MCNRSITYRLLTGSPEQKRVPLRETEQQQKWTREEMEKEKNRHETVWTLFSYEQKRRREKKKYY